MRRILAILLIVSAVVFAVPQLFTFEEGEKSDPARQQLEMGQNAMSDGLYKAADRYFGNYLAAIGIKEPEFAQGTLLRAKARLKDERPQDALIAIEEHAKKTEGLKDVALQSELEYVSAQAYGMRNEWGKTRAITARLFKDQQLPPALRDDTLLLYADAAINQQDWKAVIAALDSYGLKTEGAFPVVQRLARAYSETGDFATALKILNECPVKEGSPEAVTASVIRMLILVKNGNLEQAKLIYNALKERQPSKKDYNWWSAMLALADAHTAAGDYEEAEKLYTSAVMLSPDKQAERSTLRKCIDMNLNAASKLAKFTELARRKLADFTKRFPNTNELLDLTDKFARFLLAQGNYNEAASYFQSMLTFKNITPAMRYASCMNLGEAQFKASNYIKAQEAFTQAEQYGATPEEKANALLRAANACLGAYHAESVQSHKFAMAESIIKLYSQVIEKYASSSQVNDTILKLADFLYETKAYAQAAAQYALYAAKCSDSTQANTAELKQGICLRLAATDSTSRKAAADFLEALAEKAGGNIADDARVEEARAYRDNGSFQNMEVTLEKVLDRPDSPADKPEALYMRICARIDSGNIAGAREDADNYIQKHPQKQIECDELNMLIGDTYANETNWNEALRYYAQPANEERKSPLRKDALYESAVAEYNLDNHEAALSHINTLQSLLTTPSELSAKTDYLKGDVLSKMNRFDEARESYAKCATAVPGTTRAYSALGRQGEMLIAIAKIDKTDEQARNTALKNAEQCFRQILKDNELQHSQAPIVQKAKYSLAVCLRQENNIEQALEVYEDIYFAYRNNYTDYAGSAKRTPRPMDDFYVKNALVDMLDILEKKDDFSSQEKARRYSIFLQKLDPNIIR